MKKCLKILFSVLMPFACIVIACMLFISPVASQVTYAAIEKGGAFYVANGATVTISGNEKVNGFSATYGGAFYIDAKSSLVMNGGLVAGNSATGGGAIYNEGTVTINGGVIYKNTANYGGAIHGEDSTVTINGGSISDCDTEHAAIYLNGTNKSSFTMNEGTISSNSYAIWISFGDFNLNGGSVTGDIHSDVDINIKSAFKINGTIYLAGENNIINFVDYNSSSKYDIKLNSNRANGIFATFDSSITEKPNIENFNITGLDADSQKAYVMQDENGNWCLSVEDAYISLPSSWKTELRNSTYMTVDGVTTSVSSSSITTLKMLDTVPDGYTHIGTLSTGLKVYKGSNTDIAFVDFHQISAPGNCTNLFYGLSNCTSFDFDNFYTPKVTNMSYMFQSCPKITTLDLSNFDTSSAVNMRYMFDACSLLESIDFSNFNTPKVTNMSYMFQNCSKITTLDLSNFDTSNVTNMSYMFYGCSALKSLDLSNFDTSNVTNMSDMFYNCSSLTSLDLSNFDISNVTDMSEMFQSCRKLTSLDLSSFDMSKVTYFNNMLRFYSDMKLFKTPYNNKSNISITVKGSLEDSNGTQYTSVPANTTQSITLTLIFEFSKNWKDQLADETKMTVDGVVTTVDYKEITSIKFLKSAPSGYTQIGTLSTDIKVYRGSVATDIAFVDSRTIYAPVDSSSLFSNLSACETIELDNFDTSKVTNMSGMFKNCSSLTSFDLSNFDTSNVTDMSYMFQNCSKITTLDLLNFDTSNVTNMLYMFQSCKKLTSLDLSSFDMSKVTYSAGMLEIYSDMQLFKTPFNNKEDMIITSDVGLADANGKIYAYVPANLSASVTLTPIFEFSKNWKDQLADETKMTVDGVITTVGYKEITSIKFLKSAPSGYIHIGTLANGIKVYSGSIATDIAFVDSRTIYAPVDCRYLFYNLTNCTTIEFDNFDFVNVTYAAFMFYDCSSLTSLDLSKFDMSNVYKTILFDNILDFGSCPMQLFKTPYNNKSDITITTEIVLGDADGKKYKSLPANTLSSLTLTPILEFPRTWKNELNNATYMTVDGVSTTVSYSTITSLKILRTVPDGYTHIGTLSTGIKVYQGSTATDIVFADEQSIIAPESCSSLFSSLSACTTIELDNFNTINATDFASMFCENQELTALDLSNFDTSNVTSMKQMFYLNRALTSLNISNFDTSKVTNMSRMFYDCRNLATIGVSSFNTKNVTDMSDMFYNCSSLTSLDLSNFDTSNVTDMSYMFYSLALKSLDLSNFDTSKVTTMKYMFYYCKKLTSLNLSNFNTSRVTTMNYMFGSCSSLTSLDLSNFDTSNVTDMSLMFMNCEKLTSLNLSNFNTSRVTTMYNMLEFCSSLTSLDLSNFDTSNVTDMQRMFYQCTSLTSLDLSSFDMSKVTSSSSMLYFGSSCPITLLKTPYNNTSALTISSKNTLYDASGTAYSSVPANTTSSITLSSTALATSSVKDFASVSNNKVRKTGLNIDNLLIYASDPIVQTIIPVRHISIKYTSNYSNDSKSDNFNFFDDYLLDDKKLIIKTERIKKLVK